MNKYQKQSINAINRLEKSFEKELVGNYQVALKEIRSKLALAEEKHGLSWIEMNKYDRLTKLEVEIGKEIAQLTSKNAQTLSKGSRDVYKEAYYRKAHELSSVANADLGYVRLDTDDVKRAIANPLDRVGMLQRNRDNQYTLTRQMREQLSQGIIQGESYRTTAIRLKERMDVGASKALTIARTENHRARNKGNQDSMEKAQSEGLIMKKTWVASFGDRTRESHDMASGQTVNIDEPFDVNGFEMMYPGDESAPAEEVINCRCTTITEVEGFKANKDIKQDKRYESYKRFKDELDQ